MKGTLSWGKTGRLDELEHVLVRLVTDTGHVGLAEAPPRPTIYGETTQSIHAIIQKYLEPRLKGKEITDIAGINSDMASLAGNHTAKSAIDICLHDALAAWQGKTLLEYLAPPTRKIKVSYILGILDQVAMLQEAKSVYDQGVRVFKLKIGRNFKEDINRINALKSEFLGSGVSIYADANQGLQPAEVHDQARQLAELGVLYVEEPLPIELIPERTQLQAERILPIIADDSAFTTRDLTRELRADTFDILNIKTARTGYYQSQKMLATARKHQKCIMVGSQASSSLGTIRAAVFAGLDGIDYPSELSFFLKLEDDIVNRPIELADGYLDLDSLEGITLDMPSFAGPTVGFGSTNTKTKDPP